MKPTFAHVAHMPCRPRPCAAERQRFRGGRNAQSTGLALITNGSGEAQRAKIERFDLERCFDHIFIEGKSGSESPRRRST